MRVLVVLLHARFSVFGPIPFVLAAFFFSGHPYIGSTIVLPDKQVKIEYCQDLEVASCAFCPCNVPLGVQFSII